MKVHRVSLLVVLSLAVPVAAQTVTFVGDRANTCVSIPVGANSHVLTLSGGVSVGQTVIISAATTANIVLGTVVDSTGNTWTSDMSLAPSFRAFLLSARITSALSAGQTITLPYTNGGATAETSCAVASVFSGLVTSPSYIDQLGSASNTSAAPSVSTFNPTTQANELVIAVFATTAATGGFTNGAGAQALSAACSAPFCVFPEYKIVSATGSQTLDATLGNSVPWGAVLGTYKDVVAPVELQRLRAE